MKRFSISLISLLLIFSLAACSNEQKVEEEEEKTETVLDDVSDYTKLDASDLEVLAYDEDAEAQYRLGVLYEYGIGDVNQDFAKSLEWYTKAAEYDNADAVNAIGYFYLNGCGVDVDLKLAEEYFSRAAELGSVNSNVGLGRVILASLSEDEISRIQFLSNQESVKNNDAFDTQVDLDTTTNEKNEKEASEDNKVSLQEIDEQQGIDNIESDEILSDDVLLKKSQQIVEYFRQAEISKDLDGTYYYGYLLEKGIGIASNPTKAKAFYQNVVAVESDKIEEQLAINQSNVALGLLYMKGNGVVEDQEKAVECFKAAADNGYAKAQFYIGQCYENGYGVDKDYEKALENYQLAADQSFAPALNQIGYLYYNGYGVDVDFSSAVYYQKLASLQGYAPAEVNLGYLFENGYGVERNLETALYYYELAADAGYEGATEAVVRVRAQMNE